MNTVESGSSLHLPTVSRAVLSLAIGVAHTVERAIGGDARTRAAQANASAAVLANQERARQRDEIRRMVAELAVERPTAGAPAGRAGTGDTTAAGRTTASRTAADRAAGSYRGGPGRGAAGPGGRAAAGQLTVGSSPRSRASHASRVR